MNPLFPTTPRRRSQSSSPRTPPPVTASAAPSATSSRLPSPALTLSPELTARAPMQRGNSEPNSGSWGRESWETWIAPADPQERAQIERLRGLPVSRRLDFGNAPIAQAAQAARTWTVPPLDLSLLRNPSAGTSPMQSGPLFRQSMPNSEEWRQLTDEAAAADWVEMRHNEAREQVATQEFDTVQTLIAIVAAIQARPPLRSPITPAPHSPLTSHKIEALDAGCLDKLPALALARRLDTIVRTGRSALPLFDGPANVGTDAAAPGRLIQVQQMVTELLNELMHLAPAAQIQLLGGEQASKRLFLNGIIACIERGIERRDFPTSDARYQRIANLLLEASFDLGAGADNRRLRNALIEQAVSSR